MLDERILVRVGQKSARGDKECAAAHRGVEDSERKNLPLASPLRRAVRACGARGTARSTQVCRRSRCDFRTLEPLSSVTETRSTPRPSRGAHDVGLVVEEGLVHGAELLDAEVAIRDRFAARAIGRHSWSSARPAPAAAASSSMQRCSASGVRDGAKRRPLNGVTVSRQPGTRRAPDGSWRASASQSPGAASPPALSHESRSSAVTVAIHRMPERHQPRAPRQRAGTGCDRRSSAPARRRRRL